MCRNSDKFYEALFGYELCNTTEIIIYKQLMKFQNELNLENDDKVFNSMKKDFGDFLINLGNNYKK